MKRRIWLVSASCMVVWMVLVAARCGAQTKEPLSSTKVFFPIASEDGSTIVTYSAGTEPREIADLVFYDGTGKVRSKVEGRHTISKMYLSPDGYFLIYGWVEGKKGRWLSLYNPEGQRRFEKSFASGSYAVSIATTVKGHRTAVILYDAGGKSRLEANIILLDDNGSILSNLTPNVAKAEWLQFTPGGDYLLVKALNSLLLFDSNRLSLRWKLDGLRLGDMRKDSIAMASDLSTMAVLCRVRYDEAGTRQYWPTVLVLETKSGKLLKMDTLPKDFNPSDKKPIAYNASKTRFEVTSADKTIYAVANR